MERCGAQIHHHSEVQISILTSNQSANASVLVADAPRKNSEIDHGALNLFGPGISHRLTWSRTSRLTNLYLSAKLLARAGEDPVRGEPCEITTRPVLHDLFLRQLLMLAAGEHQRDGYVETAVLDAALTLSAVHLLRNYCPAASQISRPGTLTRHQLSRSVDLMHDLLDTPLRLTELAAMAGSSVYHHIRCFRTQFGVPPHRYLNNLRLERAATLLRFTSLQVGEIAFRVGMPDLAHFGKRFRRFAGHSPSGYRRLFTNGRVFEQD